MKKKIKINWIKIDFRKYENQVLRCDEHTSDLKVTQKTWRNIFEHFKRVSTWMKNKTKNFVSRWFSFEISINLYELNWEWQWQWACKWPNQKKLKETRNTYAVGSAVVCTIFHGCFVRFRCVFRFVEIRK